MASGDLLASFTPLHNEPPSTNYATLDQISATTGLRPVLDFDSATDETAIFTGSMPNNYASGGYTVKLWYAMDSANTTDDVVIDVAFERVEDAVTLTTNDFAAVNSATVTVPDTANVLDVATVTFTHGADSDSVTANDMFRLKVTRDANAAGDTAAGDMQLVLVQIFET